MAFFSYIGLILMLRGSGNRTLSQLNAFDFVVTVALGSILATVIINKDVPLLDGILALASLILLQMMVSWLSVRAKAIRRIVKSEPRLIFFNGEFLHDVLKRHRITEDEVLQVLRSNGNAEVEKIDAIVLETNGKFSVMKKSSGESDPSALRNVDVPA